MNCWGKGKEGCVGNGELYREAGVQSSGKKNPKVNREGHVGLNRLK